MNHFKELKTPRRFEELCYELVRESGFQNVRWRGPGADGGRDIEADWFSFDPSGAYFCQRWYIECKFYSASVPFSDIEPKLLAASVASKDCLLLITTSTPRNTAIDALDKWIESRGGRPAFRYWNGVDLLRQLERHPHLVRRYLPLRMKDGDLISEGIGAAQLSASHSLARIDRILSSVGQSLVARLIEHNATCSTSGSLVYEADLLCSLVAGASIGLREGEQLILPRFGGHHSEGVDGVHGGAEEAAYAPQVQ